jgi:hypothetical protein
VSLSGLLSVDTQVLVGRVLQNLVGQIAADAGASGHGDVPPEEVLARTIVEWIKPWLDAGPPSLDRSAGGVEVIDLEDLDRNAELAAALGACRCWGERPACPTCGGYGEPGWVRPDRALFAYYALPAVDRLRSERELAPKPDERMRTAGRPYRGPSAGTTTRRRFDERLPG